MKIDFDEGKHGRERHFGGPADMLTLGRAQYNWDPLRKIADPDGPAAAARVTAGASTEFELPAASVVVVRGKIAVK